VRTNRVAVAASILVCAATLSAASPGASKTYNASHSNLASVYFQTLNVKGQAALKSLCAAHDGQVVTNGKGQLGCQVGSLNDSKHISDGAAKGQANE